MAHTKAGGSAKRNVDVIGKRLGVKKFAGEYVKSGNIIIRQRGTKFHPGQNTELGRDYTIFAVASGFVRFRNMTGYKQGRKWVDVIAEAEVSAPSAKPEMKAPQATASAATKKPAAKKSATPRAKKAE